MFKKTDPRIIILLIHGLLIEFYSVSAIFPFSDFTSLPVEMPLLIAYPTELSITPPILE